MVRGIPTDRGDFLVGVGTRVEPGGRKVGVTTKTGVRFGVDLGVGVPIIEALIAATWVAATSTVGSSLTAGFGVPIAAAAAAARAGVAGTMGVAVDSDPTTQAVDNRTVASPVTIVDLWEIRATQLRPVLLAAHGRPLDMRFSASYPCLPGLNVSATACVPYDPQIAFTRPNRQHLPGRLASETGTWNTLPLLW